MTQMLDALTHSQVVYALMNNQVVQYLLNNQVTDFLVANQVVVGLAALVLVGAVGLFLTVRRVRYLQRIGAEMLECKELSPRASRTARWTRYLLGRFVLWYKVGPIKFMSNKEAQNFEGQAVVVSHHQTERDAVVMCAILGTRNYRYFIARNQAVGARAPLVAWTGGIPVNFDTTRGPLKAIMMGVDAMEQAACTPAKSRCDMMEWFVIFPQGKLVRNNELLRPDFNEGAIILGKSGAKKSKLPVGYICYGIYYVRDRSHASLLHKLVLAKRWMFTPVRWAFRVTRITKLINATPLRIIFTIANLFRFRDFFGEETYGVVVVQSAPILTTALPDNREQAMDQLFEIIKNGSERAQAIGQGAA
jgi:1-acyl-sn-glycerol-3-phosphate acyltransferase